MKYIDEEILDAKNQVIKDQQIEISVLLARVARLEVAYVNSSEQRQHYVKKCLELSEVALDLEKALGGWNSGGIITMLSRHSEVINQLKRNIYMEVKE